MTGFPAIAEHPWAYPALEGVHIVGIALLVGTLVLLARETPLNLAHLRNMTAVTEMGGVIFPPLPAFYHQPSTIDELVDDSVERVLGLLGVAGAAPRAWRGL